jgi:hypothetical protein
VGEVEKRLCEELTLIFAPSNGYRDKEGEEVRERECMRRWSM